MGIQFRNIEIDVGCCTTPLAGAPPMLPHAALKAAAGPIPGRIGPARSDRLPALLAAAALARIVSD